MLLQRFEPRVETVPYQYSDGSPSESVTSCTESFWQHTGRLSFHLSHLPQGAVCTLLCIFLVLRPTIQSSVDQDDLPSGKPACHTAWRLAVPMPAPVTLQGPVAAAQPPNGRACFRLWGSELAPVWWHQGEQRSHPRTIWYADGSLTCLI
jgi:hypothetical protein